MMTEYDYAVEMLRARVNRVLRPKEATRCDTVIDLDLVTAQRLLHLIDSQRDEIENLNGQVEELLPPLD